MSGPGGWEDDRSAPMIPAPPIEEAPGLEIFISEPANELFGALAAAQAELTNPVKGKTAKAGQYSYDYADIADVLEGARPILAKHGIAIIQMPVRSKFRELAQVTILGHKSGQYMQSTLRWEVADSKVQSLGGAITYLRRYSLQAMIGVAADADLDGDTPGGIDGKVYEPRQKANGGPSPLPPSKPAAGPSPAEMKAEMKTLRETLGRAFDDVLFDLGFANEAAIKNLSDAKRALVALRGAADLQKHKAGLAASAKPAGKVDDSDLPEGLFPVKASGANYPD